MARIRSIKPEFWKHPVMGRLPAEVRLLALGLLSMADDEGYFRADPLIIRGEVDPFQENLKKIHEALMRLTAVGWIELFEHPEQGAIGKIAKWSLHQYVQHPSQSKLKVYVISGTLMKVSCSAHEPYGWDQGSGIRDQGEGGIHELNRELVPVNATAVLDQPKTALALKAKTENLTPPDDNYIDLADLIVRRFGEYKYPTGGPRNLVPLVAESLRWVTESHWKTSREEAFKRMLASVERYLESPAGHSKAPKPARYWFKDDDYLLESWPLWQGQEPKTNGKTENPDIVRDGSGKEYNLRELQGVMNDGRVQWCFENDHDPTVNPVKPLTPEQLAKRGKTLFEYAQQLKWGKIVVPGDGKKRG